MALNTGEIQRKSKGGARIGAGRPKQDIELWLAARGVHPATAMEILAQSDERRKWYRLLNSADDSIVLRTLMYLTDRRDGKPAQQINVTSQSINLSVTDLEKARAIVAEIRGESSPIIGLAERAASLGDTNGTDAPLPPVAPVTLERVAPDVCGERGENAPDLRSENEAKLCFGATMPPKEVVGG